MDGVWKRLVGAVEPALNYIKTERVPLDYIMIVMIAECEMLLYSRPLNHVDHSDGNLKCLTPNHFLFGTLNSGRNSLLILRIT